MRVLVGDVHVPFVRGGAEMLADALVTQLRARGHDADLVRWPSDCGSPERVMNLLAVGCMSDLSTVWEIPVDRVIALRFPAWLVAHPHTVGWVVHQLRGLTDQWTDPGVGWSHHPDACVAREAVIAADRNGLGAARGLWAISPVVAARLAESTGLRVEVLVPPPPDAGRFRTAPAEPFLYMPGRVSWLKRHELVLAALAAAPPGLDLVISGAPDTEADLERLDLLLRDGRFGDRVIWHRFLPTEAKLDLYARCTAVVFPPFAEDLGFVALEAMASAKPVLTTLDSGGPAAFVEDGVSGWVVEPTVAAMAAAIAAITADPEDARRRGAAAAAAYAALDLSWDRVIATLLSTHTPAGSGR